MLAVLAQLIHLCGNVESVYDPRIISLQLEQLHPDPISLHGHIFFLRLKVDQAPAPWKVRKCAPFSRDDRRVIAVLARTDDTWMFIESEGDLGLVGEARAFKYDFGAEFRDD